MIKIFKIGLITIALVMMAWELFFAYFNWVILLPEVPLSAGLWPNFFNMTFIFFVPLLLSLTILWSIGITLYAGYLVADLSPHR